MRNLFAFLRRHSILLQFIITEIVCLSLLVQYNRYHQSVYMDYASESTGYIQEKYNRVERYFFLKKENEDLRRRLTELQNALPANKDAPDTSGHLKTERFLEDTVWTDRKYVYRDARVVNNSTSQPNNYLTLHRGSKQGVRPGMVVIGAAGIVGVVLDVSDNFASVMSVLHRQSRISVRLKKTGETGRLEWDGSDPQTAQLKDIPKSIKPTKGDTVVTSLYSEFPADIPVGRIEKITAEKSTNYYAIQIRLFTDFNRIQHVFVIENLQRGEQLKLEQSVKERK